MAGGIWSEASKPMAGLVDGGGELAEVSSG